jgi:hypothetical protein
MCSEDFEFHKICLDCYDDRLEIILEIISYDDDAFIVFLFDVVIDGEIESRECKVPID